MWDTGGESYNFLHANNIEPTPVNCVFEGEYMGEQLLNMETLWMVSSCILEAELFGMERLMSLMKKSQS